MAVKLETDTIRVIALFEKITKVHAKDCLVTDNCVYFLVDQTKVGQAIGKNGSVIKDVRTRLGRSVRIFPYIDDPEAMIRNIIPNIKNIDMNNVSVYISIPKEERVNVIGRNGMHIKAIKEIMKRHFKVKDLRLR